MAKMTIIRGIALALALLIAAPMVANVSKAQMTQNMQTYEYDLNGDLPTETGFSKRMTKLGRGLSNVLFGWGEIPVLFNESVQSGKSLQYLVGVVPVLGSAKAVLRTTTGVFETVTFPFTDRAVNFESVLEPDYLF